MRRSPFPIQALFCLSTLLALAVPRPAAAQQEPVAVIALSGLDRLLEDIDYLFEAAGQPQHAQRIRGVITNLNDLRGLDRQRPVGLFLHVPLAGQKDPQPLFFFPVSNLDELVTSVRIGNALRLERSEAADRLTLHTEDGTIPVKLQHGYAFLDPTKSGARFGQPLANPDDLLNGVLEDHDAVLLIRRDGIPPFLFEAAMGQLQGEKAKAAQQKSGESEAEFVVRRDVTRGILTIAEGVLADWRSTTLGLRLSAEERRLELDAAVSFAPDGETSQLLGEITERGTRFQSPLATTSAFSLVANWKPTPAGRDLLGQLVTLIRDQVTRQIADTDAEIKSAAEGILDAVDKSVDEEPFDAFARLTGAPPGGFLFLGAIGVADAGKLATGLKTLLPFAAGSKDIRAIEMDVGRAGEVAIHRIVPRSLRKQEQRLYGAAAAVYLAAGNGAVWLAVGDAGALEQMTEAIAAAGSPAPTALARPRFHSDEKPVSANGPSLFNLTMHASDWVGLASPSGGGKKARVAELARTAFADPDEDGFSLSLTPTDDGLRLYVTLDEGYVRLFGLALSETLKQD